MIYQLSEGWSAIGRFISGRTVTIELWNAATNASIPVTSNACSEISTKGIYTWQSSQITTPLAAYTQVAWRMTDSLGPTDEGFVRVGGFVESIDALISSRASQTSVNAIPTVTPMAAATSQSEHDATQAAIAALTIPSAGVIADAVWDEARSGHTTGGTYGQFTGDAAMRGTDGANTTVPLAAAVDQSEHDATQAAIAAITIPSVAAIADGVWDEARAGHTTGGTYGQHTGDAAMRGTDGANTTVPLAAATDQAEHDATQAAIAALTIPTAAVIADAVWDEAVAGHVAGGSFGAEVQTHATSADVAAAVSTIQADIAVVDGNVDAILVDTDVTIPGLIAALPTAAENADAVWEEDLSDHSGTVGSTAEALDSAGSGGGGPTAAQVADAVWDEARAGHTTPGTYGLHTGDAAMRGTDGANTTVPLAASVDQAEHDATQAAIAALPAAPTAAVIADAVWDEAAVGHVGAGSFGAEVQTHATLAELTSAQVAIIAAVNSSEADIIAAIAALENVSPADVTAAVWDTLRSGHTTTGTFGRAATLLLNGICARQRLNTASTPWQRIVYEFDEANPTDTVPFEAYDVYDQGAVAIAGNAAAGNNPLVNPAKLFGDLRRV